MIAELVSHLGVRMLTAGINTYFLGHIIGQNKTTKGAAEPARATRNQYIFDIRHACDTADFHGIMLSHRPSCPQPQYSAHITGGATVVSVDAVDSTCRAPTGFSPVRSG